MKKSNTLIFDGLKGLRRAQNRYYTYEDPDYSITDVPLSSQDTFLSYGIQTTKCRFFL